MKNALFVAAAAVAIAATPATAATTFKVNTASTSINVSRTSPCLFACTTSMTATLASFSDFTLNAGQSQTFDFATFRFNGLLGGASYDVDAQLAFSNPFAAAANGDATVGYLKGLISTTGGIVWDNPVQTFTGADGTRFSVTLNNVAGITLGNSYTARATVRLLAAAVPEPATWAMMLVGFGMVAGATRYRRRATSVSFA